METSELYEQYKTEFITNCELLQTMNPDQNPTQYSKIIKQIELLLKHISIEMCSIGAKQSTEQLSKLKPFKTNFLKRKKQWQSKQTQLLFSNSNQNSTNNDISEQNEKLSESKKLLYEIEQVGNQITVNLSKQSDQIKGSTSKVKEVQEITGIANKLVSKMLNRQNRKANAVKVVLVIIVIIVLTLRFCCY